MIVPLPLFLTITFVQAEVFGYFVLLRLSLHVLYPRDIFEHVTWCLNVKSVFFVGKYALVIVTFVHLLNVFFVASMGIGHVHGAMPGWGASLGAERFS